MRRIGHFGGSWGLTFSVEGLPEARGLLYFDVPKTLTFAMYNDPKAVSVLAFDDEPSFEIDLYGAFEPPIRSLYDVTGAIVRSLPKKRPH